MRVPSKKASKTEKKYERCSIFNKAGAQFIGNIKIFLQSYQI